MPALAFQTDQQYQNKSETVFRGVGRGSEAQYVEKELAKVKDYDPMAYSITRQSDLHKFCNLAITWKEETKFSSSVREIALNPSYQQIIGMGKKGIRYILKTLEDEPDHWFWALRAITGEDPVKQKHIGNIKEMTNDWLIWGKENGYV